MSYDDGDITTREQEAHDNLVDSLNPYNVNTIDQITDYNRNTVNQLTTYNQQVAGRIGDFNKANANSLATYNQGNANTLNAYNKATGTNAADYSSATANRLKAYNELAARTLADNNSGTQRKIAANNAANTNTVANHNANAVKSQVQEQVQNYDMANNQNAALRDVQLQQSSRKSETERFEAQRQLMNAALGVFGSLNQAMNGSTIGNLMHMLRNRNDSENTNYWQQLMDNWNSVLNSYDESYNQNQVAKKDAVANAKKAIKDIQGDLSSNLNNIQGDLSANLGTINSEYLSNLSAAGADNYSALRNTEVDRYSNARNANAETYGNWASAEGDRFNNYNNAVAEEYTTRKNESAERFKDWNQVYGDRFTNQRNLAGDLSANLNNINPFLYENPDPHAGKSEDPDTHQWSIERASLPTVNPISGGTTLSNPPTMSSESLGNITLSDFSIPTGAGNITEVENNALYDRNGNLIDKNPANFTALNNIYDFINTMGTGVLPNYAALQGYVMPENAEQKVRGRRNVLQGNDYFSQLINTFNNRLI